MDEFDFVLVAGQLPIRIRQSASGAIGAKIYPGALTLCIYFAASPLPPNAAVIEIGAGACGLPSIFLAAAGARVVSTDAPAMLPLLEANICSAAMPSSMRVAAFDWTDAEAAVAVRNLACKHAGWGNVDVPSYIIGADVVYHEPLIGPLLSGLKALTNSPTTLDTSSSSSSSWLPPTIILSYVQRFKRAKRFFKEAAKDFEVTCVAGGREWDGVKKNSSATPRLGAGAGGGAVIDYEGLTWALPRAQAVLSGDVGKLPCLSVGDADYATHCSLLIEAANRLKKDKVSCSTNTTAAEVVAVAVAVVDSTSNHHIDSDSGDEWENAASAARGFAAAVGGQGWEGEGGGGLPSEAIAAALILDVPLAPPVDSYIYILRRRRLSLTE